MPNSVTVALSPGGAIEVVYDAFGTVGPTTDALIDVTGYYTTAGAGEPGPTGPPGPAGDTGQRGLSAWDTMPAGVTITGFDEWRSMSTGTGGSYSFTLPLPARAPATLENNDVNFSTTSGSAPLIGDGDPSCSGSVSVPTAPPGKVCLYRAASLSATHLAGGSYRTDRNFVVSWNGDAAAANQLMLVRVSWAYTAP